MLTLIFFTLVVGYTSCTRRIIGGEFASPGQFPYQVSLQLKGRHHCGASIISENIVVTAAHCTYGQSLSKMRAVAGTNDLLTSNRKQVGISHVVIHPQYLPQSQDFDLSLVMLSELLRFGDNIKAIEMVSADANYAADTLAIISGYGAINGNLELPNKLKYAKVQLWSRDYCNPQNIPGITDRMICAGHPSGQVSSCQGDSGGPLTVDGKLFGVVSWGFGCGSPGRPAMYTYIGGLRQWIKQNSGI